MILDPASGYADISFVKVKHVIGFVHGEEYPSLAAASYPWDWGQFKIFTTYIM